MRMVRWQDQGWGERLLRGWLGATFAYAGVQKLADPGFLHKGSTTYIGSQLTGFAHGSPIAPLLHLVGHFPVMAGVGVALTEILIGVATLAGMAPAIAAGVGALLSVSLWLSASWHVHPYFLGSDSIYAVAWVAYLLTLPLVKARLAPAPAVVAPRARRPSGAKRTAPHANNAPAEVDDERRNVLVGGAVVLGGLALGGVAAALGHSRSNPPAPNAASAPQPSPTSTAKTARKAAKKAASVGGPAITTIAALQQKGAVTFDDPAAGPSVVVSLGGSDAAAFSRICTHAGCPVDYDSGSKLLFCPCHGSTFDPAAGAAVKQGPASTPLPSVKIVVDRASGEVRQA